MSVDDPNKHDPADLKADASDLQSARPAFYQRRAFKIAIILAIYVGSYSILSANGQYYGRPSGKRRLSFGWAITDLYVWFPAGMTWERRKSISGDYVIDADPPGWVYLPLLLIDRKWVHPTGHYFDSEDE